MCAIALIAAAAAGTSGTVGSIATSAAATSRAVPLEVTYTGLAFFTRDETGTDGNACDITTGQTPWEDHLTSRIAFTVTWKTSVIPTASGNILANHKGKLVLHGSAFAYHGFYYDEGCIKRVYPADPAATDCTGTITPATKPLLQTWSTRKTASFVMTPWVILGASPAQCPINTTTIDTEQHYRDSTVEIQLLDNLASTYSLTFKHLSKMHFESHHQSLDSRIAANCATGGSGNDTCTQSLTGDVHIAFRRRH